MRIPLVEAQGFHHCGLGFFPQADVLPAHESFNEAGSRPVDFLIGSIRQSGVDDLDIFHLALGVDEHAYALLGSGSALLANQDCVMVEHHIAGDALVIGGVDGFHGGEQASRGVNRAAALDRSQNSLAAVRAVGDLHVDHLVQQHPAAFAAHILVPCPDMADVDAFRVPGGDELAVDQRMTEGRRMTD